MTRFASDVSGVAFGAVSSIVTARVLGPSGKGTLAALTFVTVLVIQCCDLGLGDAAVVRIGQNKATAQEALSSSLAAVTLSSLVGAGIVLAYSVLQLPIDAPGIGLAVGIACLTVVVTGVTQLLIYLIYARRRVVATSVLTMAMSLTTAVATVVFCAVLALGVLGGALAGLVAGTLGFAVAARMLASERLRLRLRVTRSYLRPALSFGSRTQLANLLAYSTARLDLLFVYALSTRAEAGLYSVALTLGTITGFAAIGLSYASFPRMAPMLDREALDLTAEMARLAVVLGIGLAVAISLVLSTLIAVLLGSDYTGAWPAAVVLLVANVLWGVQWLLSRALAARGDPRLLIRSFSANLATMLAADLILIPSLGAFGAALGSLAAPAAGLVVCLRTYRQRGIAPVSFVPRLADLRRLAGMARRLGRAAARGA